jgi:uncharacterized protein (DUF1778 family)
MKYGNAPEHWGSHVELSDEDWDAFVNYMQNPPAPSPSMVRAAELHATLRVRIAKGTERGG